jgi:ABC-type spermidine/putrescine transport system permease subunit I
MAITTRVRAAARTVVAPFGRDVDRDLLPLTPAMLFLLGFLFVPLAYLLFLSVMTYDPIEIIDYTFTLENYAKLLVDPFYRQFVFYTIRVALVTTVVCLLLGYPVGYLLSRTRASRRNVLLFLVLLPLMVGTVVRTYGWMVILGTNGVVNSFLRATVGVEVELLGTTTAVVVGLVGVLLPFLIVPIYSSLESLDESLELAARNLGANAFQAFYRVTLPLSLPGVVTGSIFVFTLATSAVVTPKLLGGRTDLTIGALMYDVALGDTNWPFASAMAVLMAVITLGLIFSYLKFSRERMEQVQ